MQVHRNSANLPSFKKAVITIGTFDGVHTGHQQIIQQLKKEAEAIGGETLIITFDPHPRKVVNGSHEEIRLINTLDEKIELLARNGINHLVIIPFTASFSQMSAEEYIRDFLIEKFHPNTIIIGYDHRFGKGRNGDYHLMEAMSAVFNYRLCEIPVHILDAISVSSTRIRKAILGTEIEMANQLLGYSFFFEGRVVAGDKLGHTLGYPTANLMIDDPEKIIPGDGVYAVRTSLLKNKSTPNSLVIPMNSEEFGGMMNIGIRPTLGGKKRMIEVNIFDFNQSIYEQVLRVYVKSWMRPEIRFDGLEALRIQLSKDEVQARQIFAGP
jgi:riboflavin kinase / FMN adenylyltransferase